jgi:hypothetical protein
MQLRIGDTVKINYCMVAGIKVGRDNRPEEFRKLNRTFMLQMFEAKEDERRKVGVSLIEERKDTKEERQRRGVERGCDRIRMPTLLPEQKKIIKKGNMINPNMKKKKADKMKFQMNDKKDDKKLD